MNYELMWQFAQLSPTEISLNGPIILKDTEWYSFVFNGIPLALV